jgi:hypothetical protein
MQDKQVTTSEAENPQQPDHNPFRALYALFKRVPITWRVVGGAVVGVLILAAVARWLPNMKERMKFFTESALSWLILVIVAVQAYIYRWQAKIMGDSLMVSNRSQMDVDSIEMTTDDNLETVVLKIGNIGHVPADEIRVWVTAFYQVFKNYHKPLNGARPKHQQGYFWDFGRSKLFPGKLRITLYVPIHKHFAKELAIINAGRARFIVQVKILNKDGFGFYESEFAFRFTVQTGTKPAKWLIYPVRNQEDLLVDLLQGEDEQPRCYDIKQPKPN